MVFRRYRGHGYGINKGPAMLTSSIASSALLNVLATRNIAAKPPPVMGDAEAAIWASPTGEDPFVRRDQALQSMADLGIRTVPPGSTATSYDIDYTGRVLQDIAGLDDYRNIADVVSALIAKDARVTEPIIRIKGEVPLSQWPEYLIPPPLPTDKAVIDALTALGLRLRYKPYQDISQDLVNEVVNLMAKGMALPVTDYLKENVLSLIVKHSPRIQAFLADLQAHLTDASQYPFWLPVPADKAAAADPGSIDTGTSVPGAGTSPGSGVPGSPGATTPGAPEESFFSKYWPVMGVGAGAVAIALVFALKND